MAARHRLSEGELLVSFELGARKPQLESFSWIEESKFQIAIGESSSEVFAEEIPMQ